MKCPRCHSDLVEPPDRDGDYACGACGERWPVQSVAERDAALRAELAQVRDGIRADRNGQRWCDGCNRYRSPGAWRTSDGKCRFCNSAGKPVNVTLLQDSKSVESTADPVIGALEPPTASDPRGAENTVENLLEVVESLKAERDLVRAERDRLNGLIEAFDITLDYIRTQRARRQGRGFRMPEGHWSATHDQCLGCGRTDRRHVGHGYCEKCYQPAKKAGAI